MIQFSAAQGSRSASLRKLGQTKTGRMPTTLTRADLPLRQYGWNEPSRNGIVRK